MTRPPRITLTHIDHGYYAISDAQAKDLIDGMGEDLPTWAGMLAVYLPDEWDGPKADDDGQVWLQRTPVTYTPRIKSKRGWVWSLH